MLSAPKRLVFWQLDTDTSSTKLRKLLGCSRTTVSDLRRGLRRPSGVLRVSIERLTADWSQGAIRPEEWDADLTPESLA